MSEDGADETAGRKLYRARADAFARAQIAMTARRVSFGADGRWKMSVGNVIRCRRHGHGLALKLGGGYCVCGPDWCGEDGPAGRDSTRAGTNIEDGPAGTNIGDTCAGAPRLPEPFRGVALEQLARIGGIAWAEAHIDDAGFVAAFERLAFAFFRDTTTAFLERYGTNDDPKGAL